MDWNIEAMMDAFTIELQKAKTLLESEEIEKKFLGRKGELQAFFQMLSSFSLEEKKEKGGRLNEIKKMMENMIFQKKQEYTDSELEEIDVTLKTKLPLQAARHPILQVMEKTQDIFLSMGFEVFEGPEVDTDYYNFQTVNIPENHPARDMQDTFYLTKDSYVLRTHTSNMQNRILKSKNPPIKAIVPGRVFRYESTDASHDMTFHQVEGILVDTSISIAHLRYVMESFLQKLFGKKVTTRIRPGYFPFVEPGLELDFSCMVCEGKGCKVCKHSGWVEFMGCGMMHEKVLRQGGVDPDQYTGFAFGFGLTRLVMMLYKLDDIRLLHSDDIRFLQQFSS